LTGKIGRRCGKAGRTIILWSARKKTWDTESRLPSNRWRLANWRTCFSVGTTCVVCAGSTAESVVSPFRHRAPIDSNNSNRWGSDDLTDTFPSSLFVSDIIILSYSPEHSEPVGVPSSVVIVAAAGWTSGGDGHYCTFLMMRARDDATAVAVVVVVVVVVDVCDEPALPCYLQGCEKKSLKDHGICVYYTCALKNMKLLFFFF